MTFKLANRIKETSDTTGTGDINLTGSLDSFEALTPNKTDVFSFMCTGSNQYDGFIMAFDI